MLSCAFYNFKIKAIANLLKISKLGIGVFSLALCARTSSPFLILVGFLLMPLFASADEQDTVNFLAGITRTLDDNFFRKPSSAAPASETLTAKYVGVKVDKQYSMQRLKFDYNLTSYNYQNHSPLDFNAQSYRGEWIWALTPRLMGSVSAERTETQYGFLDATYNNKPAISTTEAYNFLADWAPKGNLHFLGGGRHVIYFNSSNFEPDRGNTVDSIDYGLKYVFPSGNVVTFMEHRRQGDYTNVASTLPNAFT